jgi:hypothetical protein
MCAYGSVGYSPGTWVVVYGVVLGEDEWEASDGGRDGRGGREAVFEVVEVLEVLEVLDLVQKGIMRDS